MTGLDIVEDLKADLIKAKRLALLGLFGSTNNPIGGWVSLPTLHARWRVGGPNLNLLSIAV